MIYRSLLAGTAVSLLFAIPAQAQTVLTNSDGIIRNSLCVGFDCQSGISFSDSTIILKENNTRIKFADTSNINAFPRNDWELEANSQSNGGANRFSLLDCGENSNNGGCANDVVFAVEAGVRSSALYVENDGDVGLGTSNPALDLTIVTGNTPSVRLQQDGSSGFTPQTWDVAGNESNFFIRDATGGSQLPFRIQPGADSNSIFVAADNDVGIGTSAPGEVGTSGQDASLHVRRTDGDASILVEEASGTSSNTRIQLQLENNGSAQLALVDNNNSTDWRVQNLNDAFRVTKAGTGVAEMELDNAGNLTIQGTLTENSDKTRKMAIEPVDPGAILAKVSALPVSSWTYIHDAGTGIRHIGPMAQDFYAAFGTGASETGISTIDTSGVALAAIQALSAENAELRARLEALEARVAD